MTTIIVLVAVFMLLAPLVAIVAYRAGQDQSLDDAIDRWKSHRMMELWRIRSKR